MATFGFSLNAMLDGKIQAAGSRFQVDDESIPMFLEYFRKLAAPPPPVTPPGRPPHPIPPARAAEASKPETREEPAPLTDVEVVKFWAQRAMNTTQDVTHEATRQKAVNDALAAVPPKQELTPIVSGGTTYETEQPRRTEAVRRPTSNRK